MEGGSSDPCKPAPDFQLSSTTDPSCSLKCKPGYKQKGGGTGMSTLQCGKNGKLSGELTCTGQHIGRDDAFVTAVCTPLYFCLFTVPLTFLRTLILSLTSVQADREGFAKSSR